MTALSDRRTQAVTAPPLRRKPMYCSSANAPTATAWRATKPPPSRLGVTAPLNSSAMLATVQAALPD